MNQTFKKKDRLGFETSGTIRQGKRIDSPLIRVYFRPSSWPRFAAVAGKRTGKSVIRNRLKRRAREIFRRKKSFLKNYDIVVIYKKGSADLSYMQIKETLEILWKKENLLKN